MPQTSPLKRLNALPASDDTLRITLSNGITVLARENSQSPSIFMTGYLQGGSLNELPQKLGLANFVSNAITRGAGHLSYNDIYDMLEGSGASLGFSAHNHTTGFSGKSLAEDLGMLLDLTNTILRQPSFPEDEMERLRAQILTGLSLRSQNTEAVASLAFDELIFPDHPYRYPVEGHTPTVQSIHRDDLVDFHQQHYGPAGMVLVIVGGISPHIAVELARDMFGDWENRHQKPVVELPTVPSLQAPVRRDIFMPEKRQVDLLMGVLGPERLHPEFLAASLGNNVFGQFGMYGRIGEAVREKAGLAYYAYSALSGGIGPGPWYISAGVDPEDAEDAIQLIHDEINRFLDEGVTPEELEDSQENYIGSLPLALESNAGVAGALIHIERYQFGLDYYLDYEERIRSITPEQVHNAAQKFWHLDKIAIAVAGTFVNSI